MQALQLDGVGPRAYTSRNGTMCQLFPRGFAVMKGRLPSVFPLVVGGSRMKRPSRKLLGRCVLVLASLYCLDGLDLHAAPSRSANEQFSAGEVAATRATPEPRAFLSDYCVACHSERLQTAGLSLEAVDVGQVGVTGQIWEKVLKKLLSGAMPPVGRRRPDEQTMEAFTIWLETELDRYALAHPDSGRPVDHRLNRFEYGNAVRDLLALDIDVEALLPADESDHGFDNIAEVLAMSPTLLGRYLVAARKISRLAVGDMDMGPSIETFLVSRGLRQNDRMSEELPHGTRGGMSVRHYFPLDGEYAVKIRLARNYTNSRIRAINTREQIDVLLDGEQITRFRIGGECETFDDESSDGPLDIRCAPDPSDSYRSAPYQLTADESLHVTFSATAGIHNLGVTFVKKAALTEGPGPALLPPRHTSSTYTAPEMDVEYVRLEGPFSPTGLGDTQSRRSIFICQPSGLEDEEICAKEILARLARKAYRRSVTDADVETLLRFYRDGRQASDFETGIQEALTRLLVSPQFLFRIESEPQDLQADALYEISDVELASRLSFFLWSSIPDDELLDLAERGALRESGVLARQIDRMLTDPRAFALAKNFGGQWLFIRNLKAVDPDASAYPEFDDNLRFAFQRETELFLESQIRDDRPLQELLTSNYTYLNERLAKFYRVPNVYGAHFRRVQMPDSRRAGILGHGSVLTVTSYATRTSPVVRGKYLLDNILGAPPPPPPPNVEALPEVGNDGAPASIRDRMQQHRENPVCATCHSQMDPLGFALENFDAIGQWRATDGVSLIDASGVLPDGTEFSGPAEFRHVLLSRRDDFVRTATEKLLTYALGRALQHYDMPSIRSIIRQSEGSGYTWSSLIKGIVESRPFQTRKAQEVALLAQE